MKKTIAFFAIIAILMMLLTLAACTPDEAYFSVKVLGPDGKPYTNVRVQPCLTDGTTCFSVFKTPDKDGITTFNMDELGEGYEDTTELEIHLIDLPAELIYETKTVKKGEQVIIVLKSAAVASTARTPDEADFTVKVLGTDGKPYTNVQVQPCLTDGTTCFSVFKTPNKDGIATFNMDELGEGYEDTTELDIHLIGLPAELTYEAKTVKKGEQVIIVLKSVAVASTDSCAA